MKLLRFAVMKSLTLALLATASLSAQIGVVLPDSELIPAGPWKSCQMGLALPTCSTPLASLNVGDYVVFVTRTVDASTRAFEYSITYIDDTGVTQTATGVFSRNVNGQSITTPFYLGLKVKILAYSCEELVTSLASKPSGY